MSDQSTLSDFGGKSASQVTSFECEVCGRSFDSNKGRGIHRAKSHTEEEIEQVLITELHSLAVELNKTPSQRDMDIQGAHSSKTYQKKFGSWNKALKQADLAINKEQSISKPDLIDELACLSNELGRTPTSRDMAKDGKYAPSSYSNEFESWNNAVREAGLEPTRERDISKEDLLIELNRLADELGHTPKSGDMRQYGEFGVSTYSDKFGSWNEALQEADLELNKQQNVNNAKLLEEVGRLNEELGSIPSAEIMDQTGNFAASTYIRRFGSWNDALREAGFDVNNRSNIPKAELLDALQYLGDELDRTPTAVDMEREGKFGWATYKTAFESWNNALQEAGFNPNVHNDIPDSALIEELQRLSGELDRTPGRRDMDKQGQFDSTTYMTSFGTWNDALVEAGFKPNKILDPDHLDHIVRSTWELEVADTLLGLGVDYEYESLKIEYREGHTYTPDFVTAQYVIEVKGVIYANEEEKAKEAKSQLDNKEYVVIGAELPADIHIPWEERANIQMLFE